MDVISAEVWQKIKSAIKAKLMELGVYIDKELPEYIMVMVCNKRSKAQMEEELKLFLGSNSVHFTTWLHQVLEKLQEIKVPNLDVKKIASIPTKRKSTDEPTKKKKKSKSDSESSEKKPDKTTKDIDNEKEIITKGKSVDDHNFDLDDLESENTKTSEENEEEKEVIAEKCEKLKEVESATDRKTIKEKSPSIGDGEDKDFLNITADMEGEDLMDEEPFDEPTKKDVAKASAKKEMSDSDSEKSSPKHRLHSSLSSTIKFVDKKTDARLILDRKTDARELLNRKKAAARLAANDGKHSHGSVKRDFSPQRRHYDDRSYDRHSSRRITVSSQDIKSRKYEEDRDKTVSNRSHSTSTLKRKSSSDIEMNNSSKDRSKKRDDVSSNDYPKKSKIISISKTLKEEVQSRVKSNEIEENKRHGVLSRVVPRRHEPEESIDTPIPSVIKVTPRPRRPLAQQASHTLILKAMADANKSTSVLQRNDKQQKMPLRTEIEVFKKSLQENKIPPEKIGVSITNDRVPSTDKCSNSSKEEMEAEDADNSNTVPDKDTNISENGSVVSKTNDVDLESDDEGATEMIDEWLDGVDKVKQSKDKVEESKSTLTPTTEGPQFVVTLNGLDPSMFSTDMDVDDEFENWEKPKDIDDFIMDNGTNHHMLKQPMSSIVLTKKTANNNNLVDVMEATKAKPIERCKYWPNCRTGDKCVYHHPIAPCKAFPACKFGEHCLFVHPQCKYNAACTRRDCPYSHSTPLLAVPIKGSKLIQSCRFFPNCANVNCPFLHPKTCKFGSYCTKKDCPFTHTEIASVDKLKWIRDGAT